MVEVRVVSFVMREKDVFPELLCIEHPRKGLILPEGPAREGEEPRRAALRVASRQTDLGNFSSIVEITRSNAKEGQRFFKLRRNEPPGALGYWRHRIEGVDVRVRWMMLDGRVPLAGDARDWLASHEELLFNP